MSRRKLDYRYLAITPTGETITTGNRLCDVVGAGERIIIDYKLMRHAVNGFYPPSVQSWHLGIRKVGEIIRRNRNI